MNARPSVLKRLMSCKWGFARAAIAAAVLWIVVADTGARLARLQLASLPDFDFVSEVKSLRGQGRYSEAELIAREGMERVHGPDLALLAQEMQAIRDERSSILRKVRDFGFGALSGQGSSLETCAGAISADLFVVGDVRDLLIQGAKLVIDGEIDPLITILSAAGIATTVAPEIDAGAAALKLARKAGALSRGMMESITTLAKTRAVKPIRELFANVARLAERVGPSGAVRLMKLADEPADVAKMAAMVERAGSAGKGYFALHATGRQGLAVLNAAPAGAEAMHDAVILAAAAKGKAGASWLTGTGARTLLKAHPIIGIAKSFVKGNAQRLVSEAIAELGLAAWWLVPLLGAWLVVEIGLILRKMGWIGMPSVERQPMPAGA